MSQMFDLEIITPQRMVFTGKVQSITCPGASGRFQILFNHAAFLSTLEIGEMHFIDEENTVRHFAVSGGISHVLKNKVMVLADTAEESAKIDIDRAKESKARAETRLKSGDPGVDIDRARLSLLRAMNRMKVAAID